MDEWLVRTSKNVVVGPFTAAEVKSMIHEGKLGLQDEVCQANHYWFYLNEAQEVKKFLDMDLPAGGLDDSDSDSDFTETSTEIMIEGSAVRQKAAEAKLASQPSASVSEDEDVEETDEVENGLPELEESPDDVEADSAALKNRGLREFRPRRKKMGGKVRPLPGPAAGIQSLPMHSAPPPSATVTPEQDHFRVEVTGGRVERPFFWRGIALFLLVIFCFLVAAVIFVIKQR
jgi:hypothetical protein